MRIAREVDEQMREDEKVSRQNQRRRSKEAEEAHWESQLASEKRRYQEEKPSSEAEGAQWGTWAMDRARGRWESGEAWEKVRASNKDIPRRPKEEARGLGIQGLHYDRWDRVVIALKAKPEKQHDMRYQEFEEFEEWKLETSDPARGKSKIREEVMRRPQRWVEIREKLEGKVEVVMVMRRKPKQ
jgi:hypothetical protein